MVPLSYLEEGQQGKIVRFDTSKQTCIRFMEMGLSVNYQVQMLGQLPLGGNYLILTDHGKYSLRKKEAQLIQVSLEKDQTSLKELKD